MAKILQLMLTHEQADEINRNPDGELYHIWSCLAFTARAENVREHAPRAIQLGLYKLAWEFPHDDLELAFAIGNDMASRDLINAAKFRRDAQSISVGNIAIKGDGSVYICAPFGWELVPTEIANLFRSI